MARGLGLLWDLANVCRHAEYRHKAKSACEKGARKPPSFLSLQPNTNNWKMSRKRGNKNIFIRRKLPQRKKYRRLFLCVLVLWLPAMHAKKNKKFEVVKKENHKDLELVRSWREFCQISIRDETKKKGSKAKKMCGMVNAKVSRVESDRRSDPAQSAFTEGLAANEK